MIAIKCDDPSNDSIDFDAFHRYMCARLPEYAVPKFIRLTRDIETTSTHKLVKFRLREEGFNRGAMRDGDRLYYFDRNVSQYLPLTEECYERILKGFIRF